MSNAAARLNDVPGTAFDAASTTLGVDPSAAPRTLSDVEAFCRTNGLAARLHRLDVPTPTVAAAAQALGVTPERIVKSLVFLVEGAPMVVIAAGESRIAYPALARALGVSRRQLRFATADQALAITGYRVGAMPPFGHRQAFPTWIDATTVPEGGVVFGGGGDVSALLEVDVNELTIVTDARRAALT